MPTPEQLRPPIIPTPPEDKDFVTEMLNHVLTLVNHDPDQTPQEPSDQQ